MQKLLIMKPTHKKKETLYHVRKFEWGMEQGIRRYYQYIPKDADIYPILMWSERYPGYLARYDNELNERGFEPGQWNPYFDDIILQSPDSYIVAELSDNGDQVNPWVNIYNSQQISNILTLIPEFPELKFSRDYELLFNWLISLKGNAAQIGIPCFVDYNFPSLKGISPPCRDICKARYNQEQKSIDVGCRGLSYISTFEKAPEKMKIEFINQCMSSNLEFIM